MNRRNDVSLGRTKVLITTHDFSINTMQISAMYLQSQKPVQKL
jgi:hypothetical protein